MTSGVAGERRARLWSRAIAACALSVFAACDVRSDDAAPMPPERAPAAAAPPRSWTVDTVDAPRFRAYGWAADTLWGIARGRLAGFADSTLTMFDDTVWAVWTAPGHAMVASTNASGAYLRAGQATARVLAPADAPSGVDFAPEMAWGNASRALLTWTAEGAPALSVLSGVGQTFTHRVLTARAGVDAFVTMPAVWLDDRHVLAAVVSHRARSGASMPSEGGRRANLGIVDVTADSIRLVTDVPDGTFLRPEGLLHADTVLVAVRAGDSHASRHVTYDTRTWTQRPRLDAPGRALACGGSIGLLRPASDPAAGGEMVWDAELHTPDGRVLTLGRYTGFDVRMLWDGTCTRLAIAQESESSGYVTVLVKQAR